MSVLRVTQISTRCVGLVILLSACQNDRPIPATTTTTSLPGQRLPESLAQLRLDFVFGSDDSDIYTARADGTQLTRLTNESRLSDFTYLLGGIDAGFPAWAP